MSLTQTSVSSFRRARSIHEVGGDERSVVRITEPGTYVLNQNLLGEPGKAGVRIECEGVRIELNGNALVGCEGSLEGVVAASGTRNVSIRDGEVRGWGRDGVDLGRVRGCSARKLRVVGNRGIGLVLGGAATIDDCTVDGNDEVNVAVLSA